MEALGCELAPESLTRPPARQLAGLASKPHRIDFIARLGHQGWAGVIELLRTNDLVLISRVEAVLAELGIAVFLADSHMSALEGSLSFLPRRVLVAAEMAARARQALRQAGLGPELRDG